MSVNSYASVILITCFRLLYFNYLSSNLLSSASARGRIRGEPQGRIEAFIVPLNMFVLISFSISCVFGLIFTTHSAHWTRRTRISRIFFIFNLFALRSVLFPCYVILSIYLFHSASFEKFPLTPFPSSTLLPSSFSSFSLFPKWYAEKNRHESSFPFLFFPLASALHFFPRPLQSAFFYSSFLHHIILSPLLPPFPSLFSFSLPSCLSCLYAI